MSARRGRRGQAPDLASTAAQVREWLAESSHVLIGAGAGLSAAAGIDYTDEAAFARQYPALVKKGFRASYELIGYHEWTPAEHWGYWATHVHDARFTTRHDPVYRQLLEVVRDKACFVVTSNVDALFARNGFDEARIYTPQGDFAHMHCTRPCSRAVWPSEPIIDRILPTIDPVTLTVTDPDVIPTCPRCGGPVFLNVRQDASFSEEPYEPQRERANAWLGDIGDEPLLVLEIGAGFNTPSVIRWPMERIAWTSPRARFVRINPMHPDVPEEIAGRSISLAADAATAIAAIRELHITTPQAPRQR